MEEKWWGDNEYHLLHVQCMYSLSDFEEKKDSWQSTQETALSLRKSFSYDFFQIPKL